MSKSASGNRQGGYDRELEQWLTEEASLLGERSAFGGLIATIERGIGGCKGSKGCGMTRHEPFETWTYFRDVIKAVDRTTACRRAFFRLTLANRWLLCARYLCEIGKLPPGLRGKLGDLAAVAIVVADSQGRTADLLRDLVKGRITEWEIGAAKALEGAHHEWREARATVDSEVAA